MDEPALISADVLARYAGDAASDVVGVSALAESPLHRGRGVAVREAEDGIRIAVHVELEWARSAGDVGGEVQRRVREYVERMTNAKVGAVDVVVERVNAPPPAR
jgi:uncharacterized alkaline shock family protein YloU